MVKIKFQNITENNIAIHFANQSQLKQLVDYLSAYGYDYGTGGSDINEIKILGISYFGSDNQYLSLDRSKKYHPRNFIACGQGWQDTTYEFEEIDWNVTIEKEFLWEDYKEEINQLAKELYDLIDYDEWAGREYGVTRVDHYWTAFNLIKAGYHKRR